MIFFHELLNTFCLDVCAKTSEMPAKSNVACGGVISATVLPPPTGVFNIFGIQRANFSVR